MQFSSLIDELGELFGVKLSWSEQNTCGVFFDEDEVSFELAANRLFIIADLGSFEGHENDYARLLSSANLGVETGYACLGIDSDRKQFTLCRILEGDMEFADFEKTLTIFVAAVRYWKKWLAAPPAAQSAEPTAAQATTGGTLLRI